MLATSNKTVDREPLANMAMAFDFDSYPATPLRAWTTESGRSPRAICKSVAINQTVGRANCITTLGEVDKINIWPSNHGAQVSTLIQPIGFHCCEESLLIAREFSPRDDTENGFHPRESHTVTKNRMERPESNSASVLNHGQTRPRSLLGQSRLTAMLEDYFQVALSKVITSPAKGRYRLQDDSDPGSRANGGHLRRILLHADSIFPGDPKRIPAHSPGSERMHDPSENGSTAFTRAALGQAGQMVSYGAEPKHAQDRLWDISPRIQGHRQGAQIDKIRCKANAVLKLWVSKDRSKQSAVKVPMHFDPWLERGQETKDRYRDTARSHYGFGDFRGQKPRYRVLRLTRYRQRLPGVNTRPSSKWPQYQIEHCTRSGACMSLSMISEHRFTHRSAAFTPDEVNGPLGGRTAPKAKGHMPDTKRPTATGYVRLPWPIEFGCEQERRGHFHGTE